MNPVRKEILVAIVKGAVYGTVLGASIYVVFILLFGPYLGLPPHPPANVTQTVTVVTQSAEISKVASLILTIEGVLLGLSPLLFDKFGNRKLGAAIITVTAISLFVSLFTILFADTNANQSILTWFYLLTITGLAGVTILYVDSAWKAAFRNRA